MLFLLYGPDEYRLSQKLNEIKEQCFLQHGSSLNTTTLDLQEESANLFWDILGQKSLFLSKKLLIVRNSFLSPIFKKEISRRIKSLAQSQDILVFVENKEVKPTDPFFLVLKENGQAQPFTILSGEKLRNWAKKFFEQLGSSANEAAIEKLLEYTNGNMWALANEIKKLSAFSSTITPKEIELLVKARPEVEIFKTTESFFANNEKRALQELQKHLDLGESPIYLISMICYQARNLLLVKLLSSNSGLSSGSLGMHPFVFKKSLGLVKNFSLEQLKNIFKAVFLLESKIKTGQENPESGLRQLATQV